MTPQTVTIEIARPDPEPFSIEKYKTGQYDVFTRDGRAVRVLCVDAKRDQPVIALVDNENHEGYYEYSEKGFWNVYNQEGNNDLLLHPKSAKLPEDYYRNEYGKNASDILYTFFSENEANHHACAARTALIHFKHVWKP